MADPRPVAIKQMLDLPPEAAIAYLDSKGYRTSVDWTDTFEAEHDASFTVAKIAKVDLLRTIHVSLLDAMAEGKPFEQWQKELQPELVKAGWWGAVRDAEVTGTDALVRIGPRRLRTIYGTNLRTARAVGLWQRIQAQKATLPFLRYSAVLDRRTRPAHRAWHGIILPVDHPFWLTHFPPCGWNCRCTVLQLSQRDLDRRGWKVTLEPPTIDLVPFRRKGDATVYQVPRGIDPGFGYNPGVARMRAVTDKVATSLAAAEREGLRAVADAARLELATPRNTALSALARRSATGPTPGSESIDLGAIPSKEISELLAATKLDMTGWSRTVDNFAARKVMNKHGDPVQSASLGQVPITPDDFELVPEIARLGRIVDYRARPPAKGKPSSIKRIAEFEGHQYTLVEYILTGARRLALLSLWKRKI